MQICNIAVNFREQPRYFRSLDDGGAVTDVWANDTALFAVKAVFYRKGREVEDAKAAEKEKGNAKSVSGIFRGECSAPTDVRSCAIGIADLKMPNACRRLRTPLLTCGLLQRADY